MCVITSCAVAVYSLVRCSVHLVWQSLKYVAIVVPSASKAMYGSILDTWRIWLPKGCNWKKSYCKLCWVQVAHSGGTTNLKNHLHSNHCPEYRDLYGDDLGSTMEDQSQPKMDAFFLSYCEEVVFRFSKSTTTDLRRRRLRCPQLEASECCWQCGISQPDGGSLAPIHGSLLPYY